MVKVADRFGKITEEETIQDRFLRRMYGNMAGRFVIRALVRPGISEIGGKLLESKASALAVRPFVKKNQIDLSQCTKQSFDSYNDFFTRKLRPEARPVCSGQETFISPCDGRLTVYEIRENCSFEIKHTRYHVESLLRNKKLAKEFSGGYVWVFRLCVDDYHRYIYVDDGVKSSNYRIPGVFHTVNPVANDCYPIYKENTREYSLLRSRNFGTVLMMEVGALLVGKIENRHGACAVRRGQEKGNFAFGGSTVILITGQGKVTPDRDIVKNSRHGIETRVRMGEKVGKKSE